MVNIRSTDRKYARPKVLVLDDDKELLERIRSLLQSNGYYVETMSTGEGAVQRAIEGNFDAVILEKIITDIENKTTHNGYSISQDILKKAKKTGAQTKTILTTHFLGSEDINGYKNWGIADLVTKPFTDTEILASINEIAVSNTKPAKHVRKDRNVLVVDDCAEIVDLVRDMLAYAGFSNPYCTTNIADSSKILEKNKESIDIVISDWDMNNVNKFLDKVREYKKSIVVMSGVLQQYILKRYPSEVDFLSKFDAFFKKPFDMTKFLKTVEYLSKEGSLLKMPEIRPRYENEEGKVIIVTGIYGAGKSTVCKLASRITPSLTIPLRDTTRQRREYEINGVDFNFLTEDEFREQVRSRQTPHYQLGGKWYSIPTPQPLGTDHLVATGLDGFEKMIESCPDANIVYLGVSPQTMAERLKERPESEAWRFEDGERCIGIAQKYFPSGTANRTFDKIIITDRYPNTNDIEYRFLSIKSSTRRLLQHVASLRN